MGKANDNINCLENVAKDSEIGSGDHAKSESESHTEINKALEGGLKEMPRKTVR